MINYPVKITSWSLDHQGGTKQYHFMKIETADGLALGITRWGKTGTFGQIAIEDGLAKKISPSLVKKENEKIKKGYFGVTSGPNSYKEFEVDTEVELSRALGPAMLRHLTGVNALALIGHSNDKTYNVFAELTKEKEEKDKRDAVARNQLLQAQHEQKAREQAAIEASNPDWGRF